MDVELYSTLKGNKRTSAVEGTEINVPRTLKECTKLDPRSISES
jgi:hypothetical protein